MKMENQEEILILLERFTKSKQKDIPRELEDYLNFVARTGDTLYGWVLVKPLFREKLVNVITDFHDNTPSIADLPQCPNVDPFNYERMKLALLDRLDSFNSAPFTVQRICELLTEPRKQYTRIDKFMRAVEKNILVVSTQEPGRRRSDSENGDSLDSIVNGDLEVNVDIEMDNEQFNLEADALLPDSSDPVGSLHNSLADVGPALDREGDIGSQLNGTRAPAGGVFLQSESNQFDGSPGKSGQNAEEDDNRAVVDTNENATDGDIGGGTSMLEDALTAARKSEEAEGHTTEAGSSTDADKLKAGAAGEKDGTEADKSVKQDTFGLKKTNDEEAKLPEATSSEPGDATEEEKPDSKPSSAASAGGSSDEEEQQTTAAQTTPAAEDDGEPQAKVSKYDVAATPSDSTDSSSGSDAEARSADGSSSSFSSSSSASDGRPVAEEKAPEAASSTTTNTTTAEAAAEEEPQSAAGPGSKSEGETHASAEDKLTTSDEKGKSVTGEEGGSSADLEAQQKPHSKSEDDPSSDASAVDSESNLKQGEVELASSNISSSSSSSTSSVEPDMKPEISPNVDSVSATVPPDVKATSTTSNEAVGSTSSLAEDGIDIEVAPGVAVSVTAETEMDEEEMANVMGNEEASVDEASKTDPDDNVMDVDESSVEPMDQ